MTTPRTAALAVLVTAFSMPAFGQAAPQCGPTEAMHDLLVDNGWRVHDQMSAPAGFDYSVICHGPDGAIMISRPDGLACVVTPEPIAGLCGIPADPPA